MNLPSQVIYNSVVYKIDITYTYTCMFLHDPSIPNIDPPDNCYIVQNQNRSFRAFDADLKEAVQCTHR